jgi:hypothetical protein
MKKGNSRKNGVGGLVSDTKFITIKLTQNCKQLGGKEGNVTKAGYFQHGAKK